MIRKLGDHHFTFVQLLRMVETGIFAAGQTDDLHPVFPRLDDKIFAIHRFAQAANLPCFT